jgi:hypothetical protein
MNQFDPRIAGVVCELRAKLNDGKTPRIPWGLYDDIIASRGLDPASYEHAGYFHAAVAGAIGDYDDEVAEYIGNSEGAFAQYCKERKLNARFQRPQPPHW